MMGVGWRVGTRRMFGVSGVVKEAMVVLLVAVAVALRALLSCVYGTLYAYPASETLAPVWEIQVYKYLSICVQYL